MTRVFQAVKCQVGDTLVLDSSSSYHLATVMRIQPGEYVTVFNGEGNCEYSATVTTIEKKKVTVRIESIHETQTEPAHEIHLGQCIARGEKMDLIIQKAVELGVSSITPLLSERSNIKLDRERLQRRQTHWQAVSIAASEQSGRTRVVKISPPIPIVAWLSLISAERKFILIPEAATSVAIALAQPSHSFALLIGPEGGFAAHEINTATAQGFVPLRLGPRILRTETVALTMISIMQYILGNLS